MPSLQSRAAGADLAKQVVMSMEAHLSRRPEDPYIQVVPLADAVAAQLEVLTRSAQGACSMASPDMT